MVVRNYNLTLWGKYSRRQTYDNPYVLEKRTREIFKISSDELFYSAYRDVKF